jgi:glycosyltransferase involved in cell wall biosynthesis
VRHLAINAVFLEPRMGGMVTYAANLLRELARLRPDLEVTVFASERGADTVAAAAPSTRVHVVTHALLGRRYVSALSEITLLPRLVRHSGADLLHSLAMTGPVAASTPHVVTVPDLIWRQFPSAGRLTVALWQALVPPVARHADRVITYSDASRREIVSQIGVDAERVDVIPLGADHQPPPDALSADQARARFDLGNGPVVLSVSAKKPHKNLIRLTRAMGLVCQRSPATTLIVPGSSSPHDEELRGEAARVGANLLLPGWVNDAELEGLYAAASCVAFPSLQEGFGLPVLDAMFRGIPVACSDASSLPEVGGAAVTYFDPFRADDIARAILLVLGDPSRAQELARAGRERASAFTWRAVAERHLEAYGRALEAGGRRKHGT